ncbi:MAG: hypothetical protein V4498_00490 [candidate division FCPU426 bacterium]
MAELRADNFKISWLERAAFVAVALRLAVLSLRSFLPLGLPELWRQHDTLGIAMRYWMRWTVEAPSSLPAWVPALLESGEGHGANVTEFPLLTLLSAPWFYFGPALGRKLACLAVVWLGFGLCFLNARLWRGKRLGGEPLGAAMILLPIFSIAIGWSGKFTPDFLSLSLAVTALGLAWEGDVNVWRLVGAGICGGLAVLMKPTTAGAFLLVLAAPGLRVQWKKHALWLGLAAGMALVYYTAGVALIRGYQTLPDFFPVRAQDPLRALARFFADPAFVLKFLLTRVLAPYVPLALLLAWTPLTRVQRILAGILGLQILFVAALAGDYVWSHDYYLMSVAPAACLFFWSWMQGKAPRWAKVAAMALWMGHLVEFSGMDLGQWLGKPQPVLEIEAAELKSRHPEIPWGQGLPFRSHYNGFPHLGLYFGERQNAVKADWGFYTPEEALPGDCKVLDRTGHLVLARCAP